MDYNEKIESLIKENETLKKIAEITKTINSTLDIAKLLNTIMESIKDILVAEASSLLFYDESTDELVFKVALGEAGEALTEKFRTKTDTGIIGWVAKNKKTVIINDVYSDDRFDPQFDRITGFKTKAIIASPLLFKGKLLGVIEGINPLKKQSFDDYDFRIFELFADQAVMAVQNAIIFEKAIYSKRIEDEIQKTKNFQEKILAPVNRSVNDLSVSAKNIIAHDLGGEFFQIYDFDKYSSFMVGDIHKNGIPGAIASSTLIGAVNSLTMTYGNKPLTLMKYLGKFIKNYVDILNEISFFFASYDATEHALEFVNTGFAYPVLLRGGKAHYLKFNTHTFRTDNRETPLFPTKIKIRMRTDDLFIIVTDGIVNLKNKSSQLFGLKRVMEIVENTGTGRNPQEIISDIEHEIDVFLEGIELREDITILAARKN